MSANMDTDSHPLAHENLTVDDLFRDLTRHDAEAVAVRVTRLATDVMLAEGAGTLVDAVAYIRLVAAEHAAPGSAAQQRLQQLATELSGLAAVWQHASDSAAISIRATRNRTQA